MARNNAVESVMVTAGNQSALVAGKTMDDLKVGQIGIFDAKTNLSLDGSTVSKDFFMAVGVSTVGSALGDPADDIVVSAGQYIQKFGIESLTFREHSASRPMIVKVGDYDAMCDTTYAIKVEFRNQEIYRTQGFNQFTKTYATKTTCCDACADCISGDANEITIGIVSNVNEDTDGLLKADIIARQAVTTATHGTSADYAAGDVMTEADAKALITYNAVDTHTNKVYTDIQLTTVQLAINSYCAVNLKHFKLRGTIIIVSMVDGFSCGTTITTTQELAFEEGNGNEVAMKEWYASGNQQNRPYKVSTVTGTAMDNINIYADKSEKYDQFYIEDNQTSFMEGRPYVNQKRTLIAVPIGDANTLTSMKSIFSGISVDAGFDDLADDITSDTSPTAVSPTTDRDDANKDGIV